MKYQHKRQALLPDEANALCHAAESHLEKLVVFTLLDTGLRVSELAHLTRQDVDWQGGRIHVKGKGGPYGAASRRRVLPLTPRTRALLEAHFALVDRIPATARTLQRLVKDVARRAGIRKPVTPHVLRHTFAHNAIQRSISLPAVQKLMGHDSLETTEIYLQLSPEETIREFREKWGAA